MAHKDWCGRPCSKCENPCALDESMPCSPCCPNLSPNGEPVGNECRECDAITPRERRRLRVVARTEDEQRPKSTFAFVIRETFEKYVTVEATDKESAMDEVMNRYDYGDFDLSRNSYVGAEFRPCCSCCHSDFDYDDDGLSEVDADTEDVKLLCDRCIADLQEDGTLTRCEKCDELFSASRLTVNPKTGSQEICPFCGEIWCE